MGMHTTLEVVDADLVGRVVVDADLVREGIIEPDATAASCAARPETWLLGQVLGGAGRRNSVTPAQSPAPETVAHCPGMAALSPL
jgi:hypothetical protein